GAGAPLRRGEVAVLCMAPPIDVSGRARRDLTDNRVVGRVQVVERLTVSRVGTAGDEVSDALRAKTGEKSPGCFQVVADRVRNSGPIAEHRGALRFGLGRAYLILDSLYSNQSRERSKPRQRSAIVCCLPCSAVHHPDGRFSSTDESGAALRSVRVSSR